MSARHDEAFRTIRREHDDVVAALKLAQGGKRRGAPGFPGYDPVRLDAAIATAGDANALLLITTAEAFLRECLDSVGVNFGVEPKLGALIDKAYKELNLRTRGVQLRPEERAAMHDLRARMRAAPAWGRSIVRYAAYDRALGGGRGGPTSAGAGCRAGRGGDALGARGRGAGGAGRGETIRSMPGVLGGDARIPDTRVPVWLLVAHKKWGEGDAEILAQYPGLDAADLLAAWDFYTANTERVDAERRANEDAE